MTGIPPSTRANAQRLRREMTPQERRLWNRLRDLNRMVGLNFRRQAPIGRYIADFAEFGKRLVIEVDGGQHDGERDAVRDAWLRAQGFEVLRFWNNEVDGNPEGVMQMVLDALEEAPPPRPSPTGGEGGARFPSVARAETQGAPPPPRGEGLGEGGNRPDGRESP